MEGDYEMAFIFLNTNVDEGPALQRILRVLRDRETVIRMSREREAQEARIYWGQAKTRQGRNRRGKRRGEKVQEMIVGIRREPRRRKSEIRRNIENSVCRSTQILRVQLRIYEEASEKIQGLCFPASSSLQPDLLSFDSR